MKIIEKIKTNKLVENQTEIQKICLDKLQSNPFPNPKSELWRLSNKSKFSNFLDYSINEKDLKFDTPYPKNSQNTIRLIIGENCQIELIEENYSIQQLSEDELDKYIKEQISYFDQNENWSDLLNLSLSCTKNILGLKIKGSKRVTLGSDYPFPLGDLEIGDFIIKMNLSEVEVEDIFCNSTLEWLNINKQDYL